jgi:dipeptidase E
MTAAARILASGGHEFNRRSGNDALCDLVVELADSVQPRICLLPTASGDPEDQISSFRRAFGERGCSPSAISLFRLSEEPVDVREHLLAQDVIYVGGGSLLNLLAIWRAHSIDEILEQCWRQETLIVGQSAGAMCWFEQGVTRSSGAPAAASGLGLLPGSACVHYLAEPPRRDFFRAAVGDGRMPPGLGLDDQTAVLYEGAELHETFSARDGAAVFEVTAAAPGNGAGPAHERELPCRRLSDRRPAIDARSDDVTELRQTLAARGSKGRSGRSRVGRLGRLD